MKSSIKHIGIGAGSGLITAITVFILLTALLNSTQSPITIVSQMRKPSGYVEVEVTRNGEIIYHYATHNIIVTIGATWVRNFLSDGTTGATAATDDIAMSDDDTPVIGWTKLPNEITVSGLARKTADSVTKPNATAYWANATWTSPGTYTVDTTGLHHDPTAGSDNNMVAAATIATASLILNDQISIRWLVNVPPG